MLRMRTEGALLAGALIVIASGMPAARRHTNDVESSALRMPLPPGERFAPSCEAD